MFFYPVYELTVYAPRSIDATETTILTPAAGAVHADPFVVTSKQGIAGTKPYLEDPSGRSATVDPLNKSTTVGTWKLRLLDARVTPGGSNAQRWVTAFLGDGKGGNVLLGRKARVRQSLDNGATWEATPFLTGRIYATALDGKPWIELTVRDLSKDLDAEVYVGAPHSSVTAGLVAYPAGYAHLPQVAPLGLLQRYGGFPQTTPLKGTVSTRNAGVSEQRPTFGITVDRSDGDPTRTLVTKAVVDAANAALVRTSSSNLQPPKIFLRVAGSGGAYTEYDLASIGDILNRKFTSITRLSGRQTTKPGAAARPVAGTVVEFYIADPAAEPSESLPLLIDDVDPIQHLRDLCAGKFGKLDDAGNPLRSIPIDTDSFDAVDTGRYIPWRKRVTKKSKLSAEIEEICRAYHLGYYLNGAGELALEDLRRSATTAPVATLGDADLVAPSSALAWQQSGDDAVTAVLGTYYLERQLLPDELPTPFEAINRQVGWAAVPEIASVGIADADTQSILVPVVGPRAGDVKTSTFKIEATGFRVRIDTAGEGSTENYLGAKRVDAIHAHLVGYAGEITGPYALGASYIDLVCRRASANVGLILQGKFAALNLSALPDPATNLRGGVRLGFCISRTEEGPNVKFRFLDAGANSVALAPAVGALSAWNGTTVGVQVPVTLNAAGEPARVSYAITDATVGVRPAEDDPRWTTGPLVTASSTATITDLPRNIRLWARVRTEPTAGAGFKLPSAWAFPAVGFIAAGVLNAPSAVVVSAATVETTVASWTNGEDWTETDVMLVVGAAPGTWPDSSIVARLSAGSTQLVLSELVQAGIQYAIGVRHRDETGGVSTVATATFTPGAASTLPAPRNPDAFSSAPSVTRFGLGAIGNRLLPIGVSYGMAVIATVQPSLVEFAVAVETGIGTGVYGAYETVAQVESVVGKWTMWTGSAPTDGLRRKMKARHVRAGANPSPYCAEVTATPGVYDPLAEYPIAAPTCSVTPVIGVRTRTTEVLQLDGAIGANDAGPLSWRYRVDDGAWSAPSTTLLPVQIVVPRSNFYNKQVTLEVTQADGQVQSAISTVLSVMEALDDTTGRSRREIQFNDGKFSLVATNNTGLAADANVTESGGKKINRTFAKALSSDPDNADSVLSGSVRRVPLTGATDASGNVNLAGTAWVNKNHDNLPDGSTYGRLAIVGRTQSFGRAPSHGQNLLFNAGFEDDTAFWVPVGAGFSVVANSANAHSGLKYAQISAATTVSARQADEQGVAKYFEVNPGDVIVHGGWGFREAGGTGTVFPCNMELVDENKANPTFFGGGVTGAVWTFVSTETTVPAGKKYARFYCQLNNPTGASVARIDDCFVKILRPANDVLAGSLRAGMLESGGKALNRLLAKALSSDPDNADSVLGGAIRRVPLLGATDVSGNVDLAGSAWVNKILDNVGDSTDYMRPPRLSSTANLAENGNFESSATLPPPGWLTIGTPTLSYDTATPYSGSRSLTISSTVQFNHGVRMVRKFTVVAGERYRLQGRLRSGTGTARVWLGLYDGSGALLSAPAIASTSGAWAVYALNILIPANAVYAQLSLDIGSVGGGNASFDEIELRRIAQADTELQRSSSDTTAVATIIQNLANTGHMAAAMQESGGKAANRLFAKALSSDVDNADSVLAGSVRRIPLLGGTDSSGNIDMGGSAWVNRHSGNLARSAGDGTAVSSIVANLTNSGHAASAMQESGGRAINRLLAKSLSSDPDTADALVDGSSKRALAFTVIDSSNRLLTGVSREAKIGDQDASSVARRAGIFFSETFDDWSTTQSEFLSVSGSPTISLQGGIGNSTVGANCLKVQGGAQLVGRTALQINPTKLYRIRARAKQTIDPTNGGGAQLYIGMLQFRADGTQANANAGAVYPCFAGETLTVAGGWVEHTAWLRGASRVFADTGAQQSFDARAPGSFNQDAVYVGMYALVNWSDTLPGNGTALIDYIQVDELDEEQADRLYHALDDGQTLNEGVHQSDGVTSRVIAKGHVGGTAKNGDTIIFPINFQNPPLVLIDGGIDHEPRAKWGAQGDGTEVGAYNAALPTYRDIAALNLTAAQFTLRARLRQKAAATARSADANTPANSLTAVGQTADATINNAPSGAVADQYTVHFSVAITCTNPPPVPPPGSSKTASVTVAIETNDGASGWQQRAAFTYDSVAAPNSSNTENFTHEQKTITVSNLNTGDQVRIRISSLSATAGATASCAVHLFAVAAGNPTGGLTYFTSAGDVYASKTPDADDVVNWEAIEVS